MGLKHLCSPKKSGSWRLILNLKDLNPHLIYCKFKMSSIFSVLNMVHRHDFLASIDLTEAYNHLAVAREHWCYLMFRHKGRWWCFTCVPNGILNDLHLFTHICRALCWYLCTMMVQIQIYIDDSCLRSASFSDLEAKVVLTISVFEKCGFTVNHKKSSLVPAQRLEFFGIPY